jgi:D-amino-acid dehydrogenase
VTVLDREAEAANFTSFGNAGLVTPGHAYAWATPAAPGMMLRSLIRGDQAIMFRPRLDPRQWHWVLGFLRECTDERTRINTLNKINLCRYSQQVLQSVVAETGVTYDRGRGGILYFYRSPRSFEKAAAKAALFRSEGFTVEELDGAGALARDPGLAAARSQIAGALFVPSDESGDCRKFTQALAKICADKGVTFRWRTSVTGLEATGGEVTRLRTDGGAVTADAYVVCLGVYAPHLVEPLGIGLPIYPVKGYSLTVPVSDTARLPKFGGVDEDNLLAYCPMGDRLRVTATAEIAGYSIAFKPGDFAVMTERAKALFPEGIAFDRASQWAGLRPMTPTGMPVIDRSPYSNLWLNTGHGHIGWTMSNGSARVLADLIAQRRPAIEQRGMRCGPCAAQLRSEVEAVLN